MKKYEGFIGISDDEYMDYNYSNIYKCHCCKSDLSLSDDCEYICNKCGLIHYHIYYNRYEINELTTDVEEWNKYIEDRKPKDKKTIINEHRNIKLTRKQQSELWLKLGKVNVVQYLKENNYRYKWCEKDSEGWASLIIL